MRIYFVVNGKHNIITIYTHYIIINYYLIIYSLYIVHCTRRRPAPTGEDTIHAKAQRVTVEEWVRVGKKWVGGSCSDR